MTRFVDSLIAYRILRLLVIPFADTDAYRYGIIDANGKELKKMSQLNTTAERDAYTILHRMIFRLKKIVEKVPIENKKLASFAAALALIKEHAHADKEPLDLEQQFLDKLKTPLTEEMEFVEEFTNNKYTLTFRQFMEEVPANNAGTSGVAGFTPDTVGVPVSAQRKRKKLYRRGEVKYVGTN